MTGEEYARMKRRQSWREYYWRNREKRLAYQHEYRLKNLDKVRKYNREYQKRARQKDAELPPTDNDRN